MSETNAPVSTVRKTAVRWRRWLPRALFESALIIFSVVLALALTNWAEERRTASRVDDMRGFLIEEMRANRATLLTPFHMPHHLGLRRDFHAAAGRQADPVDRDATRTAMQNLMSSGLHPPQLRDAVWTSVSSGELIEHMEPREVFALAEAYKAQQELEDWGDLGIETVLGLLDMLQQPDTAKLRLTRMVVYLEDLVSQEERQIDLYDRAIAELGGEVDPDASTSPDDAAPAKR